MVSYSSLCIYWKWPNHLQKVQLIIVLLSGSLINLSLGFTNTFGNLVPYTVSYIRARSHPVTLRYTDVTVLYIFQTASNVTGLFIGGILERKLGPRLVALFGGWTMSLGVLLSYFSIQYSAYLLFLTYGFMFGIGSGTAYICPISCAMKWLPKWKGLASGIVIAGFGLSSIIFVPLQTLFINPHNKEPDHDIDSISFNINSEKYFSQADVLDRVPVYFLLQGSILAIIQFIGVIFLVNPPPLISDHDDTNKTNNHVMIERSNGSYVLNDDESSKDNVNKQTIDVPPLKLFVNINFYILWLMYFIFGISLYFMATLYKTFAFEEVTCDDHFLAIVGTASALCNCIGRLVWGILADITDYKFVLVLNSAVMACFLSTLYATSVGGKIMFLIWICGIFFCKSGFFSLFPLAANNSFGSKYIGINYSLLMSCCIFSVLFVTFISWFLVKYIGWCGAFFVLSGLYVVEIILAIVYDIYNFKK